MKSRRSFAIFIRAIVIVVLFASHCESKVEIDRKEQSDQAFNSNTCMYVGNYEANYWGWGCSSQVHDYGADADGIGFWSPCKKAACEMFYYKQMTLKPTRVYVDVFLEGSGVLEVSGRRTPTFPEAYELISKEAADKDYQCSGTVEVNLLSASVEVYAIKIAAMSDRNGYALIDKITICFQGDTDCDIQDTFTCTPRPTQPPVSSTTSTSTTTAPTTTMMPTPTTTMPTTTTLPTTTMMPTTTTTTSTTTTTEAIQPSTTESSAPPMFITLSNVLSIAILNAVVMFYFL